VTLRPGRVEPDSTNLHDLATRSLGEVADFSGPAGNSLHYIHDDFELRSGVFRALMGWSGGHVACFSGEKVTADGEHIFVALFGSPSNMIGRKEQKDDFAYYPSDIAGLYGLLDAAREADDPDIDFHYRWEDQSSSTEGRVEAAVMFAHGGATRPARRLRFLARVFIEADSYDFGGDRFDSVVVGTPLWVSTTPPQRDDLHRAATQWHRGQVSKR
jgi:hypothetical protein